MPLEKYFQILSLSFGLMAAFFFVKTVVNLSVESIVKESTPMTDYNLYKLKGSSFQKAYAICGILLVVFGVVFGLLNLLTNKSVMFSSSQYWSWGTAFSFVAIVFIISYFASNGIAESTFIEAKRITAKNYFEDILRKELGIFEYGSLNTYANDLLEIRKTDEELDINFIRRALKAAGIENADKIEVKIRSDFDVDEYNKLYGDRYKQIDEKSFIKLKPQR